MVQICLVAGNTSVTFVRPNMRTGRPFDGTSAGTTTSFRTVVTYARASLNLSIVSTSTCRRICKYDNIRASIVRKRFSRVTVSVIMSASIRTSALTSVASARWPLISRQAARYIVASTWSTAVTNAKNARFSQSSLCSCAVIWWHVLQICFLPELTSRLRTICIFSFMFSCLYNRLYHLNIFSSICFVWMLQRSDYVE